MQKRLLSTRLFSVEHREYPREGREPVARDVIVHPGAVVVLPILDEQRIVMIRNYRYTVEEELWELPAGTREPDESPIETARRELEEEAGYRPGRMTPLVEFYTSPGILDERMHAYVATELTPIGQNLQGSEQISVKVLDTERVRSMLANGEFCDGKTIAVLGTYFARNSS
jgi:ADP-ribose pyrophosphatase